MNTSNTEDKKAKDVEAQEEATTENVELHEAEEIVEDAFASVKAELEHINDRYLRLGAEFENFKKRSERDRAASIRFANEKLVLDLLPVFDHLEHAIAAAENAEQGSSVSDVSSGVKMVLKQFKEILAKSGLKQFDSLGTAFDPNLHEALAQQESEKHEAGTIIQEYQKGFMLNDRLVRPARVVVSKAKQEPEE